MTKLKKVNWSMIQNKWTWTIVVVVHSSTNKCESEIMALTFRAQEINIYNSTKSTKPKKIKMIMIFIYRLIILHILINPFIFFLIFDHQGNQCLYFTQNKQRNIKQMQRQDQNNQNDFYQNQIFQVIDFDQRRNEYYEEQPNVRSQSRIPNICQIRAPRRQGSQQSASRQRSRNQRNGLQRRNSSKKGLQNRYLVDTVLRLLCQQKPTFSQNFDIRLVQIHKEGLCLNLYPDEKLLKQVLNPQQFNLLVKNFQEAYMFSPEQNFNAKQKIIELLSNILRYFILYFNRTRQSESNMKWGPNQESLSFFVRIAHFISPDYKADRRTQTKKIVNCYIGGLKYLSCKLIRKVFQLIYDSDVFKIKLEQKCGGRKQTIYRLCQTALEKQKRLIKDLNKKHLKSQNQYQQLKRPIFAEVIEGANQLLSNQVNYEKYVSQDSQQLYQQLFKKWQNNKQKSSKLINKQWWIIQQVDNKVNCVYEVWEGKIRTDQEFKLQDICYQLEKLKEDQVQMSNGNLVMIKMTTKKTGSQKVDIQMLKNGTIIISAVKNQTQAKQIGQKFKTKVQTIINCFCQLIHLRCIQVIAQAQCTHHIDLHKLKNYKSLKVMQNSNPEQGKLKIDYQNQIYINIFTYGRIQFEGGEALEDYQLIYHKIVKELKQFKIEKIPILYSHLQQSSQQINEQGKAILDKLLDSDYNL